MKRGLCALDDKRYLLADGIHPMTHGHCAIRAKQTRDFDESIPESR
jgi:phospholipase/lecithinase/hemolysin